MNKKEKPKKKKPKYVDDGHTVYSMAGLDGTSKQKEEPVGLTRRERWAAIRAGLAHYLPPFLLVLGCFIVTGLLMYFWLMY